MKKVLLSVLIIVVVVQLFVPSYMIWGKYDVLKNGEEVKIKVEPFDPYDAFRGRYVSIWHDVDINYDENRKGKYGIIEIDENGFANVKEVVKEKPEQGLYLTSSDDDYFAFPFDRYYMEETLAPEAENLIASEKKDAYITIKIKGNKSVISGLYVDGKPIEKVLTENQ